MISIDAHSIIGAVLILAAIIEQTFCSVINCEDPDYITALKNEVRPFYTLTSDPDELAPQSPCTFMNGNQIGHPKLLVHTTDSWNSGMSTCPWAMHIIEAGDGLRFPCRIATARLVSENADSVVRRHHPEACLRVPGSRHRRNDNKLCKGLQQTIPVVNKTGCRNGINDYEIQNINITVGFTCTFVE